LEFVGDCKSLLSQIREPSFKKSQIYKDGLNTFENTRSEVLKKSIDLEKEPKCCRFTSTMRNND
jgi:hypothetical protein